MNFMRRIILFVTLLLVLTALGCATMKEDLSRILQNVPDQAGILDEATVIAGIKEALQVGTENSVLTTSTVDGFLGNALIRIAVPEQLDTVTSTLRDVGLGSYVDDLEVGMNRAAELAAAEARDVLWNAITSMTVADAFGILNGHDTAATEYFRGRTGAELQTRFLPIVHDKVQEVGLSRLYTQVADLYNGLPLTESQPLIDLDQYVTDQALDGLFTVVAEEEQKIRRDPMARTTELLERVFGR